MSLDQERIRQAKERGDLRSLMEQDGHVFEKDGPRLKTTCPFHADGGPSFVLYPDQTYHCFGGGCAAHGDAISYLTKKRGLKFTEAVDLLIGQPAPSEPRKIDARRKFSPIMPAPENAPPCTCSVRRWGDPEATWTAKTASGNVLWIDARYAMTNDDGTPKINSKGKRAKTVQTWCWARDEQGREGWSCTRPSAGMPLYGLDRLAQIDRTAGVWLVEGAKKADHLQSLLGRDQWVVMSWCGGCQNTKRADAHDLEPLRGRAVYLWPDWDAGGVQAQRNMARYLAEHGATVAGVLIPPADKPQAWDCGDVETLDEYRALSSGIVDPAQLDWDAIQAPGSDPAAAKPAPPAQPESDPDDADPPADEPPAKPADQADDNRDIEAGDIANASRFVALQRDNARYCAQYECWYRWDGRRWRAGAKGCNDVVIPLAESTAKAIAAEHLALAKDLHDQAAQADIEAGKDRPFSEKEAFKEKAKRHRRAAGAHRSASEKVQTEARIKAMLVLARCRPELLVDPKDLDKHEYLLNCPNGTIDLRDGRLYKHNREHYCTMICGADGVRGIEDKTLQRIVEHVTNYSPAVAQYAQDVLGNSVFGHNRLERIYFWCGPGRSGKGTLMEAVKEALGDYATKAEFQSFVKTQGKNVRDDLDRLKTARITLASEVEKGEQLASAILKEFSGGDTIASRQLYGTYNEFRPRTTLHLQMNHKPRVDDTDDAIWERLVCIPCGPTVPADKRDPGMKEHLQDPQRGLKAVLSWLIEGAIRTHSAKRIAEPPEVVEASKVYRDEQNPIAGFLRNVVRIAPPDKHDATFVRNDDLLKAYSRWADSENISHKFRVSSRELHRRLEAFGAVRKDIRRGESTHYAVVGLTVISEGETAGEKSHALSGYTYIPSNDEHLQALAKARGGKSEIGKSENRPSPEKSHTARAPESASRETSQSTSDSPIPRSDVVDLDHPF